VTVEMGGPPLRLVVRDDGQGFDVRASKGRRGFGLTSMRERAEGLGASFSVDSAEGQGTVVCVEWS
jgi:signal transduction histidine kinase